MEKDTIAMRALDDLKNYIKTRAGNNRLPSDFDPTNERDKAIFDNGRFSGINIAIVTMEEFMDEQNE